MKPTIITIILVMLMLIALVLYKGRQDPWDGLSVVGYVTFDGHPPPAMVSMCDIKYTPDGFRYCVYDPHEMWKRGHRIEFEDDGYFAFYNVPDGEYGLILDFITHSVIPDWPGTNVPVVFDTVEGQTVILDLRYEETWDGR